MDWQHLYDLARTHLAGADPWRLAVGSVAALVALYSGIAAAYRAARLALRVAGWALLPVMTAAGAALAWAWRRPELSPLAKGILNEMAENEARVLEKGTYIEAVEVGRAKVMNRIPLRVYFEGRSIEGLLTRADRRAIRRQTKALVDASAAREREELTRRVWAAPAGEG